MKLTTPGLYALSLSSPPKEQPFPGLINRGLDQPSPRLIQVESDLAKLNKFSKSLRAEHRVIFEDMLEECRKYAAHAASVDSVPPQVTFSQLG